MARAARCPRFTGAWVRTGPDRHSWPGERADDQVRCDYRGTEHELVCHAIATHRLALSEARRVARAATTDGAG